MAREKVIIDPILLRQLYIDEGRYIAWLSDRFDCTTRTIGIKLRRYGIPVREVHKQRKRLLSPEARLRRSQTAYRGPAHHRWKGGNRRSAAKMRRESVQYQIWREGVFKRDNWTCADCKKRGSTLEAHHIKPISTHPECGFDLENGMTLCIECHKKETKRQYQFGLLSFTNKRFKA